MLCHLSHHMQTQAMPNQLTNIKAMTLIEILITIVIFSIGIVTILSILTGSLSLWWRSRNRTTATMLAKEWIEMVFNMRDTNLDKAWSWWCMPRWTDQCFFDIGSWTSSTIYFTVDVNNSTKKPTTLRNNSSLALNNTRLYTTSWEFITYTHSQVWTNASQFYRYITITPVNSAWSNQSFINSQIKKITSVVEYSQLWWTWKVAIESFIWLTR